MILLIDNYDSFVHNLARYVRELGWEAVVHRNDAITVEDVERLAPSHIIISPGPCTPTEAGISTDVVRRLGRPLPFLACAWVINVSARPTAARSSGPAVPCTAKPRPSCTMGRASSPACRRRFASPAITRWSSPRPDVPPELRVLATSRDDREVMAVEHREHPVIGVQFHPESAATEYGYAMLDRFLRGDRARLADVAARADGAPGTPPPVEDEPQTFVPPPVEHVR